MKGGKRPGSGRPKGAKSKATLEKEKVFGALRQRILQKAQSLLDSQFSLAHGQQFLYKIEKKKVVGPKGGTSYKPEKPKLVTAEWEIRAYLDKLVDRENGELEDENDRGTTYYFITTKEPSNMALDSMFDRAFGKPTQKQDVELSGTLPFQLTIIQKK
jgi:hypothetical protein